MQSNVSETFLRIFGRLPKIRCSDFWLAHSPNGRGLGRVRFISVRRTGRKDVSGWIPFHHHEGIHSVSCLRDAGPTGNRHAPATESSPPQQPRPASGEQQLNHQAERGDAAVPSEKDAALRPPLPTAATTPTAAAAPAAAGLASAASTPTAEPEMKQKASLAELWEILKQERQRLRLALGALLVTSSVNLSFPTLLGRLVDGFGVEQSQGLQLVMDRR